MSAFGYKHRKTKKNLCRCDRSHNIDDEEEEKYDNDGNNDNNSKHKRLTKITANNTSCSELHTFGIRSHFLSKRLELTAQ
jgi:hypothetical protein